MATTPSDQELIHVATLLFATKDREPYGSVALYLMHRVTDEFGREVELKTTTIMQRIYVNIALPADHDDLLFVEWVMRGILDDAQKIHSKYVTNWTFAQEWRDLSTTMKEQQ